MIIEFVLSWHSPKNPLRRGFKLAGALSLFQDYTERISKFTPTASGLTPPEEIRKQGAKLWVCHTSKESKALSSKQVAERLEDLQNSGAKKLFIIIGGPDGFSAAQVESWRPDLLWNFGPLTLPHEIAAVVAAEQIYRAWTILRSMPYHTGH